MSTTIEHSTFTDASHLYDETRCGCGHERRDHSFSGDVCWSNEPLGCCECPGFVECQHENTATVCREGGDVRGVGVDVSAKRCLSCGELICD